MASANSTPKQSFHLVLIKPSHYDDDGYVIQWAKSSIPANSLAAVYGIALDCAQRRVLGPDVEIELSAYDETNTRIRPDKLAPALHAGNTRSLVALVGLSRGQGRFCGRNRQVTSRGSASRLPTSRYASSGRL